MENQKSPGIDGIPIEFYKEFYNFLKDDSLQLYNNILFNEKQPQKTMNRAIITLIPQKRDLNKLKYWGPISSLCLDYKILTKILSKRLQKVLPNIISEEQNCSIPQTSSIRDAILNKRCNKIKQRKKHTILYPTNRPRKSIR